MTDRELFEEVLKRFQQQYKFEIDHPYKDDYIELFKNGDSLGGMNPDGFNLLCNLLRLCNMLKDELR